MPLIYMERQVAALCGRHCVNNLLQVGVSVRERRASSSLAPFYHPFTTAAHSRTVWRLTSQGPAFTKGRLDEVAKEIDREEVTLMLESEKFTSATQEFLSQESDNFSEEGNYSIQVLSRALEREYGLTICDVRSDLATLSNAEAETGYIINDGTHWYAMRKVGQQWYQINSTLDTPIPLHGDELHCCLGELPQSNSLTSAKRAHGECLVR